MICKICSMPSALFSQGTLRDKYTVDFFQCASCGFIQTEEPYWFKEAYADAITRNDVGMVSRNMAYAEITKTIIALFYARGKQFIDFGGGYGLFVRIMRDRGFDFYRYDKHCENLFAGDFNAVLNGTIQYELLTAFEVFEHLTDPLSEFDSMTKLSRNILFTTELVPQDAPRPGTWWYYGLEHGQHVSFYTIKSLSIIASKYNLNLYTDGRALHLLTDKKLSPFLFRLFSRYKVAHIVSHFFRLNSLLQRDYQKSLVKSHNHNKDT